MARFWLICGAFMVVFLAPKFNCASTRNPNALSSRKRSFIEKLDKFVSFVDRGFRSIGASIEALNEDFGLISDLALDKLNSSVFALEMMRQRREPVTTTPKPPACRDGWIKYKERCFMFTRCLKGCSINGARDSCITQQAQLAKCTSLAQQKFFVRSLKRPKWIFLGGTDQTLEGTWRWPDGSQIDTGYNNWQPGEPGGGKSQNCMVLFIKDKYRWHDQDCAFLHSAGENAGFVCESPLA